MDPKPDLTLNIKPIIINIQTHKKYSSTPFELTKDVIYNPEIKNSGKLEKYPFFTTDVCYPQKKLIEITKKKNGYNKIIYFFFNKTKFNKTLNELIENTKQQPTMSESEKINKNISIMLDLLFPTFYTPHNLYSIYDEKLLINGFIDGDFKSYNSYYSSSEMSKYSYLNVNGNKSTIFEVIWLNHILYNPIYKSFFIKYTEFLSWSKQEHVKINDEIEKLYKKLKIMIEAFYNISKPNVFNKYLFELYKANTEVIPSIGTRNLRASDKFFIELFKRFYKEISKIKKIIDYFYEQHSDDKKIYVLKNKSFYDLFEEISKIYKEADDLDSNYRNYIKKEYFNMAFKKIFTFFKNIKNLETIKTKYIIENNININYEDEDPDIIEIIKKYDYFIKFKKIIDNLKEPNRKSTNINLQKIFDTIDDKNPNSSKNSKEVIMKLNDYFKSKNKKNTDLKQYLYTGLNEINSNEKYEIFIIINIIKDVITEKNEHEIKCFFKSSFLENKLRLLISKKINPLYISKDKTYEELEEEYNNEDDYDDDDDDNDVIVNVPVKQGGAINREIVKEDNTIIIKNNPKTTNIILNISERIMNTLSFL
jgi:hypothetical protein